MAVMQPQDMIAAFLDAFNSGQSKELADLYEQGAQFMGPGGEIVVGKEAIEQVYEFFVAMKGKMEMETKYCMENGEIAMLRVAWHFTATNPIEEVIEMNGNSMEILRRQADGSWLYILDHAKGAD